MGWAGDISPCYNVTSAESAEGDWSSPAEDRPCRSRQGGRVAQGGEGNPKARDTCHSGGGGGEARGRGRSCPR